MEGILSFDEVLKQTDSRNRFLLLGNGFSMAYDHNRFSFTSLLDSAIEKGIIKADSSIHKMFKVLETADFEYIMRLLEDTNKTIDCYCDGKKLEIQELLSNDSENLKKYLVEIITNNHPEKITEIENYRFDSTMSFLENFEKIYTLNYDLLLYWNIVKINEKSKKGDIFRDGFGSAIDDSGEIVYKNKSSSNKQNIFYLHGGLHLFDKRTDFLKITYKSASPLKEQILERLKKGIYPIFISEGTAESKRQKIIHNSYLSSAYKSLQNIGSIGNGSSLILFGTTLKSNDEHIKNAIIDNKVDRIYIGINPNKINEIEKLKDDFELSGKQVFLYNYKDVEIWTKAKTSDK